MNKRSVGVALMAASPLISLLSAFIALFAYVTFFAGPERPMSSSDQTLALLLMLAASFVGVITGIIGTNLWVKNTPPERVEQVINALDFNKRLFPQS